MIIRVDSIENLLQDAARYFQKDKEVLLAEIKDLFSCCMSDAENQKVNDYIAENKKEVLDRIYLCHITRKLNGAEYNELLPLKKLLLSDNAFSEYLKNNNITFRTETETIRIYYKGKPVFLEKTENKVECNVGHLQFRLNSDFCINGFQILYNIKNSIQDYYIYKKAPEFLQELDCILKLELVKKYEMESSAYCALCIIPIDKIVFDKNQNHTQDEFEIEYMYHVLECIWDYCCNGGVVSSNEILRARDDDVVLVEKWIPEEDILCQP